MVGTERTRSLIKAPHNKALQRTRIGHELLSLAIRPRLGSTLYTDRLSFEHTGCSILRWAHGS